MSISHHLNPLGKSAPLSFVKIYLMVIYIQNFEACVMESVIHLSLVDVELYGFEEFDRCY